VDVHRYLSMSEPRVWRRDLLFESTSSDRW